MRTKDVPYCIFREKNGDFLQGMKGIVSYVCVGEFTIVGRYQTSKITLKKILKGLLEAL